MIERRLTRAEQREDTRRRLLIAGQEAFIEFGFEGASIDDIAKRAGFTRGAFYSNFDSKTSLLVSLCHEMIREISEERLPETFALPEDERLAEIAQWFLDHASQPLQPTMLVELMRRRHDSAEVAEALDAVMDAIVGAIDDLIATETTGGELTVEDRNDRAIAVMGAALAADLMQSAGVTVRPRSIALLLSGVIDPVRPTERQETR